MGVSLLGRVGQIASLIPRNRLYVKEFQAGVPGCSLFREIWGAPQQACMENHPEDS